MRTYRVELPSRNELLNQFVYNPDTGVLLWKSVNSKKAAVLIGKTAGCMNTHGYIVVRVGSTLFHAHRIIYRMMTGDCSDEIDHRNGIRHDNRWSNLRVASRQQNAANTKLSSRNRSGFKGVGWHASDRRWRARHRGKWLGNFSSPNEAGEAYREFDERENGNYAVSRRP